MKNNIHFIFDFDGTLVDSFDKVIEIFNLCAHQFHFRQINLSEIEYLKGLTTIQLIRYLHVPLYKIPAVVRFARKSLRQDMLSLPPFSDLPSVLEALCGAGHHLGILTSNSVDNVTAWLIHHQMRHLFEFIYEEPRLFGKKHLLKKILKIHAVDRARAYYIGDETRDIEAAKQIGVRSVAVTWGFNSEKILMQHAPYFIAHEPNDLLKIGIEQMKT